MKYITKENLMKGNILIGVLSVFGLLKVMFLEGTIYDLSENAGLLKPIFMIVFIWVLIALISSAIALFYRKDKDKEYKIIFGITLILALLLLNGRMCVEFICAAGDVDDIHSMFVFFGNFDHFDMEDVQRGLVYLNLAYLGVVSFGIYQYRAFKKLF